MPAKQKAPTEITYTEEPRSLFQSIKLIVQSIADAMTMTSTAVGKIANMADSLAETGVVMADSNKTLVTIETKGKEARKLQELKARYPDITIDL